MFETLCCPICSGSEKLIFQKELNVSCGDYFEGRRLYETDAGIIDLVACDDCGFTRFPEMFSWSADDFRARIYNEDYHLCDAPFEEERPQRLAKWLVPHLQGKSLLDYGGGNGRLAQLLFQQGVQACSFDPFYNNEKTDQEQKDVVTAFEVVEHVPNQMQLFAEMKTFLKPNGVVIFSTLLRPQNLLPDWWYASPRNGHIAFHTHDSLSRIIKAAGFCYATIGEGMHLAAINKDMLSEWERLKPIQVNGEPDFYFQHDWRYLMRRDYKD